MAIAWPTVLTNVTLVTFGMFLVLTLGPHTSIFTSAGDNATGSSRPLARAALADAGSTWHPEDLPRELKSVDGTWYPENAAGAADVALCMSGHSRTLGSAYVLENSRQHVLDRFNGTVDLFIRLYVGNQYGWVQHLDATSHTTDFDYVRHVLRPVFFGTAFPEIIDTGKNKRGCCVRAYSMFTAIERCFAAVEAHERARGTQYRWVFRIRPDVVYDNFPVEIVRAPEYNRPDGPAPVFTAFVPNSTYGISDWFHGARRDVAGALFGVSARIRTCMQCSYAHTNCTPDGPAETAWNWSDCLLQSHVVDLGPAAARIVHLGLKGLFVRVCSDGKPGRDPQHPPLCPLHSYSYCCVPDFKFTGAYTKLEIRKPS